MIRCKDCVDTVVCHHCRWFYDPQYWCSKHNRTTYPSDICNDYVCRDAIYEDILFRYSLTASTGGLAHGL